MPPIVAAGAAAAAAALAFRGDDAEEGRQQACVPFTLSRANDDSRQVRSKLTRKARLGLFGFVARACCLVGGSSSTTRHAAEPAVKAAAQKDSSKTIRTREESWQRRGERPNRAAAGEWYISRTGWWIGRGKIEPAVPQAWERLFALFHF